MKISFATQHPKNYQANNQEVSKRRRLLNSVKNTVKATYQHEIGRFFKTTPQNTPHTMPSVSSYPPSTLEAQLHRYAYAAAPTVPKYAPRPSSQPNVESQASTTRPTAGYGPFYRSGVGPNTSGWTPLMRQMHEPMQSGKEAQVLTHFPDESLNEKDRNTGHTALMHAAINGKTGFVKAILDRGTAVAAQDSMGRNAVASAAAFGQKACLETLISHPSMQGGFTANGKLISLLNAKDHAGLKPLALAARNGKNETLPTLLDLARQYSYSYAQDIDDAIGLAQTKYNNVMRSDNIPAIQACHQNLSLLHQAKQQISA